VNGLAQCRMCVNCLFDLFKGRFQRDSQALPKRELRTRNTILRPKFTVSTREPKEPREDRARILRLYRSEPKLNPKL
jgi:hypothetical protein